VTSSSSPGRARDRKQYNFGKQRVRSAGRFTVDLDVTVSQWVFIQCVWDNVWTGSFTLALWLVFFVRWQGGGLSKIRRSKEVRQASIPSLPYLSVRSFVTHMYWNVSLLSSWGEGVSCGWSFHYSSWLGRHFPFIRSPFISVLFLICMWAPH